MNVLITSASRKVSLVRSFQHALTAEGGGQVIAVDVNPLSAALYEADEHFLVPRSTEPHFLDTLLRLCQQQHIRLLIPTRDEELPLFATHRDLFAAVGTVVMVADPTTVQRCQDKQAFLHFCQQQGFAVPATYAPPFAGDTLPAFPVFVKPRYGKSGQHTRLVHTESELQHMLERMPDALIQEYIQTPEYTIDLFADFQGRTLSVVPRERTHVFGGESFVSRTVNNPALIAEALRLANALHLIGHNTMQCFFDGEKAVWIEVNPRFGGAAHLSFAAGAATPHFLVQLLAGNTVSPQIGSFRDNYVMLRYTEDRFLDANELTGRMFE
jgi:carbamoyl-phosphate synthase large subunit